MSLEIAKARPEDTTLAVPTNLRQSLENIMANFSKEWGWQLAANAPYFSAGAGGRYAPEGLIIEGGIVYNIEPRHAIRPAMILRNDGRIDFTTAFPDANTVKYAIGAGPMLVRQGKVTDIRAEIRAGQFSGFDNITTPDEHTAVGKGKDGLIYHFSSMSVKLVDLAAQAAEVCSEVMKFDGGGTTAVMKYGRRHIGYFGSQARSIPCGFVMRRLVEDPVEAPKWDAPYTPVTPTPRVNALRASTNFMLYEFESPDTHEVMLEYELLDRLQRLRTLINKPVVVTSAYRTPEWNKHVAGVGDSQHLYGKAVDITVQGLSIFSVANAAEQVGFRGIGTYQAQGFVHVDVRRTPARWSEVQPAA